MLAKWVIAIAALAMASHAVAASARFNLVPEPRQVVPGEGVFVLSPATRIDAPANARAQWIAKYLRDAIHAQTGVSPGLGGQPARAGIVLSIDPSVHGDEAYRLEVTPARVTIAASGDRGLFWGVQTLRQLLATDASDGTTIPAVRIDDTPRFEWRGVMLDTARHFYPVAFIEKQLDLMAYYKFNVFHWHLTDDQAWRIQIKRYPKLTSVGAWRTEEDGSRYGGLYTQDQIREVVRYARQRNIMVVPEIEMPGHSSAAIAAYPELSCSGKPIQVPTTWGVFRDVDCVGKDSTFRFLENVLDEVTALFPAPYVHIGGDEVPQGVWEDCASCRRVAAANDLHGEAGLHGYFVRRIQKYLAGKGKAMIGWDEIMEGGMDPDAIAEVWRGPDEARKALANGNRVIVAGPFYLDTPIDDMTLQDLYRNDPFARPPYTSHPGKVLGGEAPLWSEHASPVNGEARLWPRLLALAEHFWTPADGDYAGFLQRTRAQEAWLASQHVALGLEDRNIIEYRADFVPQYKRWRIRAARGFDDLEVHYTTDGSEPTARSPAFGDVLDLYAPATVALAPFRGDRQYELTRRFRFTANLALGKPVKYATPPAGRYFGGPRQLVNGILGSTDFRDGAWAGWQGTDMDATIDMGKAVALHAIGTRFLQTPGAWVLLPRSIDCQVSRDGKSWTDLGTVHVEAPKDGIRALVREVACPLASPVTARYIKVSATGHGRNAAGGLTWIFSDEIIVQ